MSDNKRSMFLIVFLLLLFMLTNHVSGQTAVEKPGSAESKAEEQYNRFLAVFQNPNHTTAQLETALGFLKEAYALSPSTYKYAFSQGAAYYRLGKYADAAEWFARSRAIAATDDQRQATQLYLDDCVVQLAKVRVKEGGKAAGFEVIFTMKEGTVELERKDVAKLPQRLPEVNVGEPVEPIMSALTRAIPGLKAISKDVFVVAGNEDTTRLERHYERGIKDFYRFFKGRYFPDGTKRIITVVISPTPEPLLAATKKIYPDAGVPLYAPFLGYYNPRDNLIMATGGETGYGTLLHEMVHAMMESDFPGAPLWLKEGLASLYERTRWIQGGRLEPLPNWRMDLLKGTTVGSMAEIAAQTDKGDMPPHQMAKVRLLLLFLEQQGRTVEAYSLVKQSQAKISLAELISRFGLKEDAWQAFVEKTFSDYRLEIRAEKGITWNPEEVRFVQAALNKTSNAGLKVDGVWTKSMAPKVKEFQRKFRLPVTGTVDTKTMAELKRQFTLSAASQ